MNVKLLYMGLFIFLVVLAEVALAGNNVWVYSNHALLRKDTSGSAKAITSLSAGTELIVLEQTHRWLKVATQDGQSGWIYRGKISNKPITATGEQQDADDLSDIILVEQTNSDIEAEETYTARSIRGAHPDPSHPAQDQLAVRTREYAMMFGIQKEFQDILAKSLAGSCDANTVEVFLKEGKIGEYAKNTPLVPPRLPYHMRLDQTSNGTSP